jgi:hypothetical protein
LITALATLAWRLHGHSSWPNWPSSLSRWRIADILACADADLTAAQLSKARLATCGFRGCVLAGMRGVEQLAGADLAPTDVMELTLAFATKVGIVVGHDVD